MPFVVLRSRVLLRLTIALLRPVHLNGSYQLLDQTQPGACLPSLQLLDSEDGPGVAELQPASAAPKISELQKALLKHE